MRYFQLTRFFAAAVAIVFLSTAPASAALASNESILNGDDEIEAWVREIQAELLLFTSLSRAHEIGRMAVDKATNNWGDDRTWSKRYVLIHGHMAMTNTAFENLLDVSNQPDSFPDKDKFFDQFFDQTMSGISQLGPMLDSLGTVSELSEDEKDMVAINGNATRGRFYCAMSKIVANAPDDMDERGHGFFKSALKTLKNTSAENIANIAQGISESKIDSTDIDPVDRDNLVRVLEEQRDIMCGR